MNEVALQLGFVLDHIGCPCSGKPKVYVAKRDNGTFTLTTWDKRSMWKLVRNGYTIANGNADNLKQKIEEIWDL